MRIFSHISLTICITNEILPKCMIHFLIRLSSYYGFMISILSKKFFIGSIFWKYCFSMRLPFCTLDVVFLTVEDLMSRKYCVLFLLWVKLLMDLKSHRVWGNLCFLLCHLLLYILHFTIILVEFSKISMPRFFSMYMSSSYRTIY